MAGISLMDSLFQSSLDAVIKSLRLCPPGGEPTLIAKSLEEIRREIKSTDPQTKSVALEKLAYFHSLHGIDMSWAAFHSVELSSAASHSHKRVACLSAALSFNPSTTDVILLLTHQLRKDLSSSNVHDVSLALSTLSSICNPDLSRDLTPELFTLLGSSRFFVRKKAIAVVLRVFEQYPDAVRACFKRVVENLESTDMGILSAVVGVLCELSAKDPRSYLPLAPEFYKILVDCRNNWVLIKILKIFTRLAPVEPRLGKKVVEPTCEHLRRTGAKSLAYECVRAIVTSFDDCDSAMKLAVEKLREFLLDDDPNLKFLALQALAITAEKHMWVVVENQEMVVRAMNDEDINIKLEALRLVMSMVSEDNVMQICTVLISHARKSDPYFCNEILGFILQTCSRNFYEAIFDFDWYVSFLGEMARLPHCEKGGDIAIQLVDIGMRVKDARNELVRVARDLVIDPALLGNPLIHGFLGACAWISGEYVKLSKNPFELMEALLQPRTNFFPPAVRSVYIQSAFKVLASCLHSYVELSGNAVPQHSELSEPVSNLNLQEDSVRASSELSYDSETDNEKTFIPDVQAASGFSRGCNMTKDSILRLLNFVEVNLRPLAASDEVEVQERASNVLGVVELVKPRLTDDQSNETQDRKTFEIIELISDFFSEELGPVSLNAQERVWLPDGLVLKKDLNDLEEICGDINFPLPTSFSLVPPRILEKDIASSKNQSMEASEYVSESTSLLAKHRKRYGLYYLHSDDEETAQGEYPPAEEPRDKNATEEADDFVKLAEKSLGVKKSSNKVKTRPVVVKLDEGVKSDIGTEKLKASSDLLSGAVQEVLLGNVASTSSSKGKSSASTRKEHHHHGKDKKHQTSGKNTQVDGKNRKKRESQRHKHKPQQGTEGEPTIGAQSSPTIPDLLL